MLFGHYVENGLKEQGKQEHRQGGQLEVTAGRR
jgi:hypothetical protein